MHAKYKSYPTYSSFNKQYNIIKQGHFGFTDFSLLNSHTLQRKLHRKEWNKYHQTFSTSL
ncbi:hypothetical protein Pint_33043 [Pistacia integerrima]|uniref:Uncharacterized protein n=1 Tax=Pistacia integerrima TaxID=434235 RepID=A0ACC0X5H3_9ROSI|nr:hypothetical protein Pint_33043 [Pistacia integerrima]